MLIISDGVRFQVEGNARDLCNNVGCKIINLEKETLAANGDERYIHTLKNISKSDMVCADSLLEVLPVQTVQQLTPSKKAITTEKRKWMKWISTSVRDLVTQRVCLTSKSNFVRIQVTLISSKIQE